MTDLVGPAGCDPRASLNATIEFLEYTYLKEKPFPEKLMAQAGPLDSKDFIPGAWFVIRVKDHTIGYDNWWCVYVAEDGLYTYFKAQQKWAKVWIGENYELRGLRVNRRLLPRLDKKLLDNALDDDAVLLRLGIRPPEVIPAKPSGDIDNTAIGHDKTN